MELDDESKKAVQELGDAINEAIEKSARVIDALEEIRRAGYEPNIAIKLNIGLMPIAGDEDDKPDGVQSAKNEFELELTDEDLRELRKMNISLE